MAPLLVTTRPMTTSTALIPVVPAHAALTSASTVQPVSGHHSAAVEADMTIDQDTTVMMIPTVTDTTVPVAIPVDTQAEFAALDHVTRALASAPVPLVMTP